MQVVTGKVEGVEMIGLTMPGSVAFVGSQETNWRTSCS